MSTNSVALWNSLLSVLISWFSILNKQMVLFDLKVLSVLSKAMVLA